MKKLLMVAIATAAMTATPAMAADSDSKNFRIRANVQPECSVADPQNVNFGNLAIERAPGSGALLLTTAFDNDFQNIWTSCNYAAKITLTSTNGGMTTTEVNDGPDAADFTDTIHYNLSLRPSDGNAFSPVFLTTGQGVFTRFRDQTDAFHDDAVLRTTITQAFNPLRPLAGRYTDTAVVSVGPI
ncbi:spore coat protein U domain-containing protein [Sphingorhabdus sp. M41]|uniref:spore coat protein U domain-containing protein n=1 Tax=Sphingorhabdus sp. M41 TaxID=1806885 RepID=UPI0012E70D9B|nr:spore coat protein U domain-containing protein [Sphingorhabdus sp. M41]